MVCDVEPAFAAHCVVVRGLECLNIGVIDIGLAERLCQDGSAPARRGFVRQQGRRWLSECGFQRGFPRASPCSLMIALS